jgi:glutamine amidotransferase
VAIVDYGVGNLFSVRQACESSGLEASITHSRTAILSAEAVILPGVGAFGDAMEQLRRLNLIGVLEEIGASDKPLLGVCLGMQVLMENSEEFGAHRGLGLLKGSVVRLRGEAGEGRRIKVPHVGWNRLEKSPAARDPWEGTLLQGLPDGVHMYFVHSYYAKPLDGSVVLATTPYGPQRFASVLQYRNIFACQCHPERSGPAGLTVYRNLALRRCGGTHR